MKGYGHGFRSQALYGPHSSRGSSFPSQRHEGEVKEQQLRNTTRSHTYIHTYIPYHTFVYIYIQKAHMYVYIYIYMHMLLSVSTWARDDSPPSSERLGSCGKLMGFGV